jgi:hypothetical protein
MRAQRLGAQPRELIVGFVPTVFFQIAFKAI